MKCIIVRYSEIGLKGKNKSDFEKRLADNIKIYLKHINVEYEKVQRKFSRIIVFTEKEVDLSPVFGISSFSYATIANPDLEEIKNEVSNLLTKFTKETKFRVSTQRLDKGFPMNSMEVDREVGAHVVEKTSSKVSLKEFDVNLGVEILPDEAYVFDNKHKAEAGLPVGVEGKVVALIDNEDSIQAARNMMRRGCFIVPVGFKEEDVEELRLHSPIKMEFHKIKNIKEIEKIAEETNSKALVVGQKLDNFSNIDIDLLVFRPLIAE